MQLYQNKTFSIYFGGIQDKFFPDHFKRLPKGSEKKYPAFTTLQDLLQIKKPIFLHQLHGTDGLIIASNEARYLSPFSQDGDYLITNVPHIGIGVVTADCLPIILYDPDIHVIAVVHAGWRGSMQSIVYTVVGQMNIRFGSEPRKIKAIFGPCGRACCYQVQKDFLDNLGPFSCAYEVVYQRTGRLFFDLVRFNQLQLLEIGLKAENIDLGPSVCTICNHSYYSHRRQGASAGRNMSVAVLK